MTTNKLEGIKVHPAADLFPMMEGDEYEAFRANIKERGQQEPVLLLNGMLLDGRNRWRALTELGVKPEEIERKDVPSDTDADEMVISLNLHRRHLNESQRGLFAARQKDKIAVKSKERQKTGKAAVGVKGESRDIAGRLWGVSGKTVDRGSQCLRLAVEKEAEGKKLLDEIFAGKMTINAALSRLQKSDDDSSEPATLKIKTEPTPAEQGNKVQEALAYHWAEATDADKAWFRSYIKAN